MSGSEALSSLHTIRSSQTMARLDPCEHPLTIGATAAPMGSRKTVGMIAVTSPGPDRPRTPPDVRHDTVACVCVCGYLRMKEFANNIGYNV